MGINPIKLTGNWDEGYALDVHTISSIPSGEDVYGHVQFDTQRSEMGELLYWFKYKGKHDNLHSIVNLAKPFLNGWVVLKTVDVILPVPSSVQRMYQPASEIAQAIAEYLKINYTDAVLEKITKTQSKDMDKNKKDLSGTIIANKKAKKPHTILLVDDLYSTGKTLTECIKILRQDEYLQKIYVLTMTKTR